MNETVLPETTERVVLYKGRVYDVDAEAWETFSRPTRCVVLSHEKRIGAQEHLRVQMADYPAEPYVYLIFNLDEVQDITLSAHDRLVIRETVTAALHKGIAAVQDLIAKGDEEAARNGNHWWQGRLSGLHSALDALVEMVPPDEPDTAHEGTHESSQS